MNIYCTLFDSNYLTRGLAMYQSIKDTGEAFRLFIFAFDDLTHDILIKMALPNVEVVSLQNFESDMLLSLKKERSRAEYCWTCTPFSILYVMERYGVSEATYLDADLFFFNKPELLLQEFRDSGCDVMISKHRYSPQYVKLQETSGIYCVQFMTFKNNENGLAVLKWWRDRCIECCTSKPQDGKFGDQKYLDDWPERFCGIHVMKNLGGGVAPWNVLQYVVSRGPAIDNQKAIFYHYHGFKVLEDGTYKLNSYYLLPQNVIELFYLPYVRALEKALKLVRDTADASFTHKKTLCRDKDINYGNIMKAILSYGLDTLKKSKYLLVYGAGTIARDVVYVMSAAEIEQITIVVSNPKKDSYFMGNKIRGINEFKKYANEAVVIVAVREELQQELVANARKMGFRNIISLI